MYTTPVSAIRALAPGAGFGGRLLNPLPSEPGEKCFNTPLPSREWTVMAKKQDSGFHSAAGLIRYFDQEDEKALKVPPWIVVALCVALSVIILYVTYALPLK